MNFLNPAFLIGLPLVAVPLIIHLLSRRQQKRISWGAMRFLKEAATRKRRLWRLTDILLLLLRTAAFLFFIFALARPLLPAAWLGGSIPRDIILVLDQSMSMSRKQGDGSLFDLQREKANAVLSQLTNRDTVRVLLAGESPEWLTPEPVGVSPSALRRLREQLDRLKPTLGNAELLASVREAADLEVEKDRSARAIIVLTDGQRFGWRIDERPLWSAVEARLHAAPIPTNVDVQFIRQAESDTTNVCVNRIEALRPFAAVNQEMSFTAQIQNRGASASAATLLSWRVDEQSLGVATVPELAAGASTSVTTGHQFLRPGLSQVSCRLETKDALTADNDAHLLVEVFDRLPVLLVEEANAAEPLQTDSAFVLAALGAQKSAGRTGTWQSVFQPTLLEPKGLSATDLMPFRAIIIADPARLDPSALEKLESYVRAGGGLWIALGAHCDEKFFNEQLFRGGNGLVPLKLKGAVGDANDREKYFPVRASSETHPATALLADFQRLDLDRVRVYRRYQFDLFSGRDVSVLLEVQQGDPAVVERKLDRGRVLVQTFPLGVSWSSFPLCQAYVAMLHEWLWYLAEPTLPKRNLAVGETIVAATRPQAAGQLSLPDDRTVDLEPFVSAGNAEFRHTGTRLPGEYVLRVKGAKDESATTRFLVKRNPEESNLKALSEQEIQQIRATGSFTVGAGLNALVNDSKTVVPRHPIEGWLLAALALALGGELLLAGWSTHRRNLRLNPVTMGT